MRRGWRRGSVDQRRPGIMGSDDGWRMFGPTSRGAGVRFWITRTERFLRRVPVRGALGWRGGLLLPFPKERVFIQEAKLYRRGRFNVARSRRVKPGLGEGRLLPERKSGRRIVYCGHSG